MTVTVCDYLLLHENDGEIGIPVTSMARLESKNACDSLKHKDFTFAAFAQQWFKEKSRKIQKYQESAWTHYTVTSYTPQIPSSLVAQ